MKLLISTNDVSMSGYVNFNTSRQQLTKANLDNACADAECTHVVVDNILNYTTYEQIPLVLRNILLKLRHKGQATIIFTDINRILRQYNTGNIDEKTLNENIFNGKHSLFSIDYMHSVLKALKFNILWTDINESVVTFFVERP